MKPANIAPFSISRLIRAGVSGFFKRLCFLISSSTLLSDILLILRLIVLRRRVSPLSVNKRIVCLRDDFFIGGGLAGSATGLILKVFFKTPRGYVFILRRFLPAFWAHGRETMGGDTGLPSTEAGSSPPTLTILIFPTFEDMPIIKNE